ncbi:MAG: hypothetical protein J0H62_07730, partial [Rhizobiales bacterium]|nr:hypothetical protein [Hyphomicrobiales bacterium]
KNYVDHGAFRGGGSLFEGWSGGSGHQQMAFSPASRAWVMNGRSFLGFGFEGVWVQYELRFIPFSDVQSL